MTALMWANVALGGVTATLGLVLAGVYWRNHRAIKSPFTLGLLLFAAFVVVHNVLLLYHLITMMPQFAATGEATLLLEGALQAASLSALLWATLR